MTDSEQYPAGDGGATRAVFQVNAAFQWVTFVWALACYFRGHTSHALFWMLATLAAGLTVQGAAIRAILIARLSR
jgi:hypothetical protein